MRSECMADYSNFRAKLLKADPICAEIRLEQDRYGEIEAVFSANISFVEIRDILRQIPDGHVMLQTVNRADRYTGERNYDVC